MDGREGPSRFTHGIGQSSPSNRLRAYLCRRIYPEALAHTAMDSGKPRICKVGWQVGTPREEPRLQSKFKGVYQLNSFLLSRGRSGFYSMGTFDWMKAVLTREENLLSSHSTNFRYVPGGPVLGGLPSSAGDMGVIPGQRTKIPRAVG